MTQNRRNNLLRAGCILATSQEKWRTRESPALLALLVGTLPWALSPARQHREQAPSDEHSSSQLEMLRRKTAAHGARWSPRGDEGLLQQRPLEGTEGREPGSRTGNLSTPVMAPTAGPGHQSYRTAAAGQRHSLQFCPPLHRRDCSGTKVGAGWLLEERSVSRGA